VRIAVLADAHGNQFGFFAALANARKQRPDLIVSAGDMLCSFPGGPGILQTLLSEQIPCVRGNADDHMIDWFCAEPMSSIRGSPQFLPLRISCSRFQESDFQLIEQWPLTQRFEDCDSAITLLVCHGTPESNTLSIANYQSPPVSEQLNRITANAVAAGHYHHQWSENANDTLLVLAGSCGMPCANGINAQYAILDLDQRGIRVQHRSVEYDHKGFIAGLVACNYAQQAGPVGWLELAQLLLARPLMLYYFRDRFDPTRGADLEYLVSSIKSHLTEYGALAAVEAVFGPLDTPIDV
jgi:predicted phosphodiesterase